MVIDIVFGGRLITTIDFYIAAATIASFLSPIISVLILWCLLRSEVKSALQKQAF